MQKISFTSYSGKKDEAENFAYLPVKIMENQNNTPIVAQWNYRIMCHPIEGDLPTDRFQVIDDLGVRMARGLHINEFMTTRAARFQLNANNESDSESGSFYDYEFLDELMYQVPGVDNYPADIEGEKSHPSNAKKDSKIEDFKSRNWPDTRFVKIEKKFHGKRESEQFLNFKFRIFSHILCGPEKTFQDSIKDNGVKKYPGLTCGLT